MWGTNTGVKADFVGRRVIAETNKYSFLGLGVPGFASGTRVVHIGWRPKDPKSFEGGVLPLDFEKW